MKATKVDCGQCGNKDKSIFCELEEKGLQSISDQKIMNTYKKGQVLFHEGNPAFGVYCISSGKIKLTKLSESGKEIIISISGPGDIVGSQHIVKAGLNDVTATALEETKICFIDREFMNKTVKAEPSCAMELVSHLTSDALKMHDRMAHFSHKNVRERVAYLLIDLARSYGSETPQGTRLGIQLSREDMAGMLGIASETLIRELSILKEEGVIEQDGKTIILLKKNELESLIS